MGYEYNDKDKEEEQVKQLPGELQPSYLTEDNYDKYVDYPVFIHYLTSLMMKNSNKLDSKRGYSSGSAFEDQGSRLY